MCTLSVPPVPCCYLPPTSTPPPVACSLGEGQIVSSGGGSAAAGGGGGGDNSHGERIWEKMLRIILSWSSLGRQKIKPGLLVFMNVLCLKVAWTSWRWVCMSSFISVVGKIQAAVVHHGCSTCPLLPARQSQFRYLKAILKKIDFALKMWNWTPI